MTSVSRAALRSPWAIQLEEPPALPGWQQKSDIFGSRSRNVIFHPSCALQMTLDERRPYGTPYELLVSPPTLKRGANHHCAYGAGEGQLPAWSAHIQAPLRGPQRSCLRLCRRILTLDLSLWEGCACRPAQRSKRAECYSGGRSSDCHASRACRSADSIIHQSNSRSGFDTA